MGRESFYREVRRRQKQQERTARLLLRKEQKQAAKEAKRERHNEGQPSSTELENISGA